MTPDSAPPPLENALLRRLAEEARVVMGLVIRGVSAVAGDGVLLRLGRAEEKELRARLLVVTASGRARAHLVSPYRGERTEPDVETAGFVARLAHEITSATIEDITADSDERIVRIPLRLAHGARATLIGELFGATPNLVLVDADSHVRACRRTRKGNPPLAVGLRYETPRKRANTWAVTPLPDRPPRESADPGSTLPPWSAFVAEAYAPLDRDASAIARARALLGPIRAELARFERRIEELETDRVSAQRAPRERELADLLAANFTRLRHGATKIEVEDLYRGGSVELALDPALPAHENVARRYRRVEKLERSLPHVEARLIESRARRELLIAARDACESATRDTTALAAAEALAVALGFGGAPRRNSALAGSRIEAPRDPGIRRFTLKDGATVLVGKDDEDNDRLTHRMAKSHDIWFHVEGFPGSHVVLRVPKGKTAALPDLLAAGQLAVHFSKRRGAARANVTYTPKKFVRKGRGKAGLAMVERHKTLTIDHDAELLREMLSGGDGAAAP